MSQVLGVKLKVLKQICGIETKVGCNSYKDSSFVTGAKGFGIGIGTMTFFLVHSQSQTH